MEYIFQNKTQAQEAWRRRKNRIKVKDSSLEFLHAYHEVPKATTQPRSIILPPHKMLHKINQARKSNRKAKKQKKLRLNPFEGGLILPMYELNIEANASENHWTIDHMSLAESEDGTPAVIHGVPSTRCSGCAFDFIIKNNITPVRVNGHTEMFDLVNVASPECDTKTRTHRVCVITLPQIHKAQDCKKFLRQTDFDLHYLIKLKFFGNVDIDSNVDATIVLGDFRLEKEVLPEKMLLLRLSGMLSNDMYTRQEKEAMALNIYNALRPLSGKRGYEMRRFGGSSGPTCHESDRNLLRVLFVDITNTKMWFNWTWR